MDSDRINQMLSNLMEKAGKVGYGNYYDQLCPTEKDKKSLPKQAVFLAGLGE
jgi:hypothetical protein